MDLLSGIINTIMGPDSSQMSEADRKKTEQARAADRNKASDYAFRASNGQAGDQFMRPETSVGLGISLEDVLKMMLGGGKGGG
jgi:hypothetical protein